MQHTNFISSSLLKHDKLKIHVCYSSIFMFQVGKCLQLVATLLGGFIIAFAKGRLLTLVMLSSILVLGISGAIIGLSMTKLAARGQDAYSAAATVVEQTTSSIRTVCILGLSSPKFSLFQRFSYIHGECSPNRLHHS